MAETSQITTQVPWKLWPVGLILFIPLLQWVPYWFPVPENVVSASAAVGYSTKHAYNIIFVFVACCIMIGWLAARRHDSNSLVKAAPVSPTPQHSISNVQKWLERCLASILPWIIYCPLFLPRYGPFVEDTYFLSLLNRMHDGQIPYADFETLYSPLMVYLPYYWSQIVGHSMVGYYAYICILESLQYLLIVVLLQKYIPNTKHRLLAIILLSGMMFNTLLAPTWNGLRRLFPLLILLYASQATNSTIRSLLSGLLLGLMMAYSHDFGAACAIGLAGAYLVEFANTRSLQIIMRLAMIGIVSLCIWVLTTWAVLGNHADAYFQHSVYSMGRYSQEGGFQFYWTLNSLAVFALIIGTALLVGAGSATKGKLSDGDLFLVATFVYAIIAMKSGMNRCDMWHLVPPTFGLVLWWILPLNKSRFSPPKSISSVMISIAAIISTTYFIALAPTGQYYVSGLLKGGRDVLSGISPTFSGSTRFPSILRENSYPEKAQTELAEYLNQPDQRDRPVFLYSRLWSLDKAIGIIPKTYPTDDFLLSESAGIKLGEYVSGPTNPLVIVDKPVFDAIYAHNKPSDSISELETSDYFNRRNNDTPMKKLLRLTSTVHYVAAPIENIEKEKRWMRTVGFELKKTHHKVAQFGQFVVLSSITSHNQAFGGS